MMRADPLALVSRSIASAIRSGLRAGPNSRYHQGRLSDIAEVFRIL